MIQLFDLLLNVPQASCGVHCVSSKSSNIEFSTDHESNRDDNSWSFNWSSPSPLLEAPWEWLSPGHFAGGSSMYTSVKSSNLLSAVKPAEILLLPPREGWWDSPLGLSPDSSLHTYLVSMSIRPLTPLLVLWYVDRTSFFLLSIYHQCPLIHLSPLCFQLCSTQTITTTQCGRPLFVCITFLLKLLFPWWTLSS